MEKCINCKYCLGKSPGYFCAISGMDTKKYSSACSFYKPKVKDMPIAQCMEKSYFESDLGKLKPSPPLTKAPRLNNTYKVKIRINKTYTITSDDIREMGISEGDFAIKMAGRAALVRDLENKPDTGTVTYEKKGEKL